MGLKVRGWTEHFRLRGGGACVVLNVVGVEEKNNVEKQPFLMVFRIFVFLIFERIFFFFD